VTSSITAILINDGNATRHSLVRSSSTTKMAVPQEGVRRRTEDSGARMMIIQLLA